MSANSSVRILVGDCRARLAEIENGSVNTCVTSPPYFGLRDYGHAGQVGQEPTPAAFVEAMVSVFQEVRRVLRDDGTLWLNLGDSYTTGTSTAPRKSDPKSVGDVAGGVRRIGTPDGLKAKDLIGIPWRVALALQADGWYLRQDIIWHKPNPMPESVTDRCTKAHEYIFLLSKGPRYYFDQDAIVEGLSESSIARLSQDIEKQAGSNRVPGKTNGTMNARARGVPARHRAYESSNHSGLDSVERGGRRNKRSVWTVATQPFKEAHFATYPPELIEPCILAGAPRGGLVLDPFGGAGTTGLVADRLGRNAVLIELNPEYAAMAQRRIAGDAGMFSSVEVAA